MDPQKSLLVQDTVQWNPGSLVHIAIHDTSEMSAIASWLNASNVVIAMSWCYAI